MYLFEIRVLLNLFLETTDRQTERSIVVARRIDAAIVVEKQAVRVLVIRRGRPVAAVV